MCGHWLRLHQFCLWIWLNRKRIAHLCKVKRLTKLQSVPNICRGKKKRDKHIRQFAALSRCWKGSYNILQHQAKRPENLKVFDRMQTNSSNQVKQPLCGSFPKCECSKNRMTMRQHEGQGTAMNNRERPCMGHEWQWMITNGVEAYIPPQPLPSQLSTECRARCPQCSVLAPLAAVSFDPGKQAPFCFQLWSSHIHTHMIEHISASIFHIQTAVARGNTYGRT